jgi:hypothetical protein
VQPLYKTIDGKFTNATGSSTYASKIGTGKLAAPQFAKPPATLGKAPMTKATVASRGDFGGAATARTSTGG